MGKNAAAATEEEYLYSVCVLHVVECGFMCWSSAQKLRSLN